MPAGLGASTNYTVAVAPRFGLAYAAPVAYNFTTGAVLATAPRPAGIDVLLGEAP